MDRLKKISEHRESSHKKLLSLKSKVYEAFLEMEKAAYCDGALPKKAKELIAVGISVVIDCESCMQWHIEQAARAGASMREVLEAGRYAFLLFPGYFWVFLREESALKSP